MIATHFDCLPPHLQKESKIQTEADCCRFKDLAETAELISDRAHRGLAETLVEADQPAENLLAVRVQLLQLVLDERRVLRRAPLDQALSKHDQPVDALGVQSDLLPEALRRQQVVSFFNLVTLVAGVRACAASLRTHVELLDLVVDVALGKVLHVCELQVQLGQPHQHAVSGAFKLLPLAGEKLTKTWRERYTSYH